MNIYQQLAEQLEDSDLQRLAKVIPDMLQKGFNPQRYGELNKWQSALEALPDIKPDHIELVDSVALHTRNTVDDKIRSELTKQLKQLHPWRKGPFNLFATHIEAEWRSDWKWDRIKNHIQSLQGKTVLDVGCGNGYHCWRMAGMGAEQVIGIDPTPVFVMQYLALQHYIQSNNVYVLPAALEDLPENLQAFDTVFSMGVLYHRRSPLDHILALKNCLKPGGELILETLIIEGNNSEVLIPEERYAQMNNVWFIPTVTLLEQWLARCKFTNIHTVDVTQTSVKEQHTTDWMTFQSLSDFLDADDHNLTIEGYPAPRRAMIIAEKV